MILTNINTLFEYQSQNINRKWSNLQTTKLDSEPTQQLKLGLDMSNTFWISLWYFHIATSMENHNVQYVKIL